jgi:hypothetical protein
MAINDCSAAHTELDRLGMDVAVPILGSMPCDKAAYHKGLVTLEQKLAVLDGHLRSHTFLVSTCGGAIAAAVTAL